MREQDTRILMVDDDIDYLEQNQFQLRNLGYQVTTAVSRQEAQEFLKKEQFHVAIIDMMMEKSDDGLVLAYEIKKMNPAMPVFMVTAVTSKTGMEFDAVTREEKSWIKADMVFTKPIRIEQIVREIKRLVK